MSVNLNSKLSLQNLTIAINFPAGAKAHLETLAQKLNNIESLPFNYSVNPIDSTINSPQSFSITLIKEQPISLLEFQEIIRNLTKILHEQYSISPPNFIMTIKDQQVTSNKSNKIDMETLGHLTSMTGIIIEEQVARHSHEEHIRTLVREQTKGKTMEQALQDINSNNEQLKAQYKKIIAYRGDITQLQNDLIKIKHQIQTSTQLTSKQKEKLLERAANQKKNSLAKTKKKTPNLIEADEFSAIEMKEYFKLLYIKKYIKYSPQINIKKLEEIKRIMRETRILNQKIHNSNLTLVESSKLLLEQELSELLQDLNKQLVLPVGYVRSFKKIEPSEKEKYVEICRQIESEMGQATMLSFEVLSYPSSTNNQDNIFFIIRIQKDYLIENSVTQAPPYELSEDQLENYEAELTKALYLCQNYGINVSLLKEGITTRKGIDAEKKNVIFEKINAIKLKVLSNKDANIYQDDNDSLTTHESVDSLDSVILNEHTHTASTGLSYINNPFEQQIDEDPHLTAIKQQIKKLKPISKSLSPIIQEKNGQQTKKNIKAPVVPPSSSIRLKKGITEEIKHKKNLKKTGQLEKLLGESKTSIPDKEEVIASQKSQNSKVNNRGNVIEEANSSPHQTQAPLSASIAGSPPVSVSTSTSTIKSDLKKIDHPCKEAPSRLAPSQTFFPPSQKSSTTQNKVTPMQGILNNRKYIAGDSDSDSDNEFSDDDYTTPGNN